MKTKMIALNSVAVMALAGICAFSVPARAQYVGNPPQYSSPAEKAETQKLNEQEMNGTSQSPSQLNAEPSTDTDNAQPGPSQQAQPGPNQQAQNDQQTQYQNQQQQYQDQQQQYQDQRAQYDGQQKDYQHDLRRYDRASWNYDYPHAYAYEYDSGHLQRLSMLAEPSQQLAQVPVEGPNGVWVGKIRNVEIGPDGTPARVEVSLNRRVSVWVRPHDLRFDPEEHVAYTNLTRDALWDMPGATVESGPM